ncbi:3201_t:CDS:1 [Diversispora eburnea]|uniref:3201_t:CDS:1 n=1 Tax=Diversispora eburnea TaxID=1213867 RepID=A0A9N8VZC2_9GLOM|nr:3201_t:CDS:1 [Diversispora eburnea]
MSSRKIFLLAIIAFVCTIFIKSVLTADVGTAVARTYDSELTWKTAVDTVFTAIFNNDNINPGNVYQCRFIIEDENERFFDDLSEEIQRGLAWVPETDTSRYINTNSKWSAGDVEGKSFRIVYPDGSSEVAQILGEEI